MDIENDDALVGIGKRHRVMIWDGNQEQERKFHWGLPSRDPEAWFSRTSNEAAVDRNQVTMTFN